MDLAQNDTHLPYKPLPEVDYTHQTIVYTHDMLQFKRGRTGKICVSALTLLALTTRTTGRE